MRYFLLTFIGIFIFVNPVQSQMKHSSSGYNIYSGSTHAHTIFTMSHGAHWDRKPGHERYVYLDSQNVNQSQNTELKSDWRKYQGPPSEHFAIAKANGYDFYITTDHSQEAGYHPTSPISAAWLTTKQQAVESTDSDFVALVGYEHSENNGPGGRGHINVINSSIYLNALEPGIDLPYLYNWLEAVKPNGEGPVVATFNHPGRNGYNGIDPNSSEVTEAISMLEVINSNDNIYYEGFINALDKGWKVSPVCGNDNHNIEGIVDNTSRTFVLAKEKTKTAILDAMKNRRTYASLEQNIEASYTVNGAIMGSILERPDQFEFDISISDPDTNKSVDKITKIDIVKDKGEVVETYTPSNPSHSVQWSPVIQDSESTYFFVRVWNSSGGDAAEANPDKPVAWLAPVWTGR